MEKKISNKTLRSLVSAINNRDLNALDKLFADDVIVDWPQSGERIIGSKNLKEIYNHFPIIPKITANRILGQFNLWVLEAALAYDNDIYHTVFIFEINNGLISREIGYWSKPFPAPQWRRQWVEDIDFSKA